MPTAPSGGATADWLTPVLMGGLILALGASVVLLVLWLAARRRAEVLDRIAGGDRGWTQGSGDPQPAPELDGVLIRLADVANESAAAQAERALAMLGIEPIPVHSGDRFDDRVHQVATTQESPDPEHDDHIAGEVRRGWRRGPQVVRPADVSLWVPVRR